MRKLLICFVLAGLIISGCQNPKLRAPGNDALPAVLVEGFNAKRWYFTNQSISLPLQIAQEKTINGLPVSFFLPLHEQLFLVTRNGFLLSLDQQNFKNNHSERFSRGISTSPSYLSPLLFLPLEVGSNGLAAYHLLKGKTIWKLQKHLSRASPLLYREYVLHLSIDGTLSALEAQNGKIAWEHSLGATPAGNAAMTDGQIVVATVEGDLHSFKIIDGAPLWSKKLKAHLYAGPLILKNSFYIADLDGNLQKMSLSDGSTLNQLNLHSPFYQPPSCDGKTLFLMAANGTLFSITQNLQINWQVNLKAPPTAPTLVTNKYLLVGNARGFLYVVSKKTGMVEQKLKFKHRPTAWQIGKDGQVFVGVEFNKLLRLTSGTNGTK